MNRNVIANERFSVCRRALLASTVFAAALVGVSGSAKAETEAWPTKPIMWVVGYGAGGSVDTVSRVVAKHLEGRLGKPVIIDNRPGASGVIALNTAARAQPDGYTIVTIPGPVLTASPAPSIGKELIGVAQLAKGPMVLVGTKAKPMPPSLKALLEMVKAKPDAFSFASSGNGTSQHLAGELINQMTSIKLTHVPYKGGSAAVTDIIGGFVPLGVLGITPVLPFVKSGKLTAYGVTTATRNPALPNVPTLAEAGIPGFEASQWFVVAAAKGTPQDRITKLNAAINEALTLQDVKASFEAVGVVPAPASPSATTAFVAGEQKRWSDLAKKANLPLD
ncbi:putative Bug-like extra-cytoplasmic solute receptor, TTT family [Cupriavidus taiwanensis]|uniref:Bug family tripartite tricarboxylate transporter substrate binding protein n=1 Tax=Cupriavidus taiwanensis TaxID=164546 RepID=UPI000E17BD79|nr:tripartite tricarboxylate transporter substrate binding protein [Cupriavidus taiwanensis]SPA02275.1 putative Bug-like extra-cytoplasmic solute receptor, TTT family [Cupriavidus taiwanensis]